MPIDPTLTTALHLERLAKQDVRADERSHHVLFQTSTIDALLDGNYDGDVSFAELETRGDFGLGTFDALDGEMVGLDGDFFRIRSDGRAYTVNPVATAAFAVVTFFEPDLYRPLSTPMDYPALRACVEEVAGGEAPCYAVRVDGYFDQVKARSVPQQQKPYPPLVEVTERQSIFELRDVRGSLVGFRFPDHARGLNVPGYHFHFITEDRRAGGHVFECRLAHGELRVDREADLRLELPNGVSLPTPGATTVGQDILERIEKDSGEG